MSQILLTLTVILIILSVGIFAGLFLNWVVSRNRFNQKLHDWNINRTVELYEIRNKAYTSDLQGGYHD